ncbi:hypothetical protein GCM10023238_23810 [Streptomyces heliomycini]
MRVDEGTARAARERAPARGMSVNRSIEELVRQDTGEAGRAFVEAAADFMKQYESVFAEESGGGPSARAKPGSGGGARRHERRSPLSRWTSCVSTSRGC